MKKSKFSEEHLAYLVEDISAKHGVLNAYMAISLEVLLKIPFFILMLKVLTMRALYRYIG